MDSWWLRGSAPSVQMQGRQAKHFLPPFGRGLASATVVVVAAAVGAVCWIIAKTPPLFGFGSAVAAAMAWCRWLERHPTAPSSVSRDHETGLGDWDTAAAAGSPAGRRG